MFAGKINKVTKKNLATNYRLHTRLIQNFIQKHHHVIVCCFIRNRKWQFCKCQRKKNKRRYRRDCWKEQSRILTNIKDGCVYQLHGVGVRFREQSKYLTTTRVTRIIEDDDEALKALDDSTALALLLPPDDITIEVESIKSVNIETFQSCVECSAKIPPAIQTKIC